MELILVTAKKVIKEGMIRNNANDSRRVVLKGWGVGGGE